MSVEWHDWDIVTSLIATASGKGDDERCWRGIERWRKLWEENKAWAMPYLGSDGRLETKLTVDPDTDCLYYALDEAYDVGAVIASGAQYRDILCNSDLVDAAVRFLRLTACNAGVDAVAKNRFDTPIVDPMDDGKRLPAGTRFTKYMSRCLVAGRTYCASELNQKLERQVMPSLPEGTTPKAVLKQVEQFLTTVYSQIAQGMLASEVTVALSANPVDIVLASSHTSDWSSCHDIFDGCYATGPIDYLIDKCTLIAFAYRDSPPINSLRRGCGCEISWPRKLWRQMVYFDAKAQGAVMSREYPGANETYAKEARALAALLLSRMHGVPHDWKVGNADCARDREDNVDSDDCIYVGKRYSMCVAESEWHYPDLPTRVVRMLPGGTLPEVFVGVEDMPCPLCGDIRESGSEEAKSLVCAYCAGSCTCEECGNRIRENDVYEAPDNPGTYYCRACYRELYAECRCCGNDCFLDDMAEDAYGNLLCPDCICNERYQCDHCEEHFVDEDVVTAADTGNVYCESCADDLVGRGSFYRCADCGDVFECESSCECTEDGGETYCQSCAEWLVEHGRLYRCEDCGLLFERADNVMCVDGEYYCHACCPESARDAEDDGGDRGEAA